MKKAIKIKLNNNPLHLTKETQEERKERVRNGYFGATRTRVCDKRKNNYNRQKFKNDWRMEYDY